MRGVIFLILFLSNGSFFAVAQESVEERILSISSMLDANSSISDRQRAIVTQALSLIGKTKLNFGVRSYPWDCSGTVMSALYLADLDCQRQYISGSGNGVRRLYQMLEKQNLLYNMPYPQVGDLIFWDNTYDANGDKKWNDELSHVGLVIAVYDSGVIEYIHHDYRRGITIARMNLLRPSDQFATTVDGVKIEINSSLRMKSHEYLKPGVKLSGQLFKAFGNIKAFEVLSDK